MKSDSSLPSQLAPVESVEVEDTPAPEFKANKALLEALEHGKALDRCIDRVGYDRRPSTAHAMTMSPEELDNWTGEGLEAYKTQGHVSLEYARLKSGVVTWAEYQQAAREAEEAAAQARQEVGGYEV